MTEEEYLAFEEKSDIRHEYVDGHIFAMTGASDAHNVICLNLGAFIHGHLRGGPCLAYMNDMKVRIESGKRYYYPDIMVSCEAFAPKGVHKSKPVLIVEILSQSTKQTDLREKLVAYQNIPSLMEYVVVYQDRQQLQAYRRIDNNNWELEVLIRGDTLTLSSLQKPLVVPLDIIYERYDPPSRVKEDEAEYDFDPLDPLDSLV